MTTVPIIARGDGDMSVGVHVPGSFHRSAFLRLGKQLLLDNQTERLRPEDVVIAACHLVVSQGVLSSTSVIGISRWRYLRISPEHQPLASLEGRCRRCREFSPDPPAKKPARLPVSPRHRKGGVEDRPTDLRRVEIRRRAEDLPADPRRVEMPAPMKYLPRLDLTEEILLDRMEERLHFRRGGQDEVHQPLGGEPLMTRIRTLKLPMGWMTLDFFRFDGKGDIDQYLMEYRTLMAPNDSDNQLARIFKQSLKGQALLWYVRLRKNSINSFEALAREFSRQYAYNRTQPKKIDTFFDLKMGSKESLKDFVTRFRKEASKVIGADRNERIICAAFKNALLEGHPMKVDLIMKLRVYLFNLYKRAQKRIRIEVDALRGKRTVTVYAVAEVSVKAPAKEERTILQEFKKVNPLPFDRNKGKAIAFPQPKSFCNPSREYTRFTLSPEQILEKIRGET